MSVVSLENESYNMCVDCEVRLLKLNGHRSVSVSPSDLQSIVWLANMSRL